MAVTLQDVAERAQVSVRTVSNVVSNYPHISDVTRARVQAAIQELGYQPNLVARTLRTGKTGIIALSVPELDVPYFSELAKEVIKQAGEYGYSVIVLQTGNDLEQEEALLRGETKNLLFDGLLFTSRVRDASLVVKRKARQAPIVLLGEYDFDGTTDHVAIDNRQAAREAVEYLISSGRKHIAAIGAQPDEVFTTPLQRTLGYQEALRDGGLSVMPEWLVPAEHYSREDGYLAMRNLLSSNRRPDAVFCFSDLLAVGALRAAHDFGVKVPDDIAVVGIDDIPEGRYQTSSLTSVSINIPYIAKTALNLLVNRIEDPKRKAQQCIVPHSLVIRESA
ncbi:LacI family DNA-binding transcriptional regulator [uncultured Actinomyces sp.]|uniref:LacI family DNA-binding transcriptional regulator n=1 Tax=uncultured Actinomyces sp. TaxID=249061 RepID=UPI0028E3C184|nr:LacI family DNA-binding transcriptional regulator [uncultured Actinomyces sp.]